MLRVAVLGGRPADGTLLPKVEKEVWKEIQRVIKEDVDKYQKIFNQSILMFPLYSKFDLEVLRVTEKLKRPVEYYIPDESWGTKYLPNHQIDLIQRISANKIVVPNAQQRVIEMINRAHVVYLMNNTYQIDYFNHALSNKVIISFSEENMRFKTEEEAIHFQNRQLNDTMSKEEQSRLIKAYFEGEKI